VKLLLDEQISGKVADRLRQRGHDVLAVTAEPSLRGLADPDLFELAQRQGRAVVTYNRADFEVLIREYAGAERPHHGLVVVHPIRFPNRELARLTKALGLLLEQPDPGGSFLIWLQAASPKSA
jgi:predicted nuclease of predicted toxin-antitoxin system